MRLGRRRKTDGTETVESLREDLQDALGLLAEIEQQAFSDPYFLRGFVIGILQRDVYLRLRDRLKP